MLKPNQFSLQVNVNLKTQKTLKVFASNLSRLCLHGTKSVEPTALKIINKNKW